MAINEANSLTRLNPALNQEKEEFVYRSYLAMGQSSVIINEVKITSNISSCKSLNFLSCDTHLFNLRNVSFKSSKNSRCIPNRSYK
jgi:hypothetical protein